MKRREFITLAGSAAAWPVVARAQQSAGVRRIGVLAGAAASDPVESKLVAAFADALETLGWKEGRNIEFDYRWAAGAAETSQASARELIAWRPDAILSIGTLQLRSLMRLGATMPIVFLRVSDPVGDGFVQSLARPGGNITGFSLFDFGIAGKWLEFIKEAAPRAARILAVMNADNPASLHHLSVMTEVASKFSVQITSAGVHSALELERALAQFDGRVDGAVILLPGIRQVLGAAGMQIAPLMSRYGLPAIGNESLLVRQGLLMGYESDPIDQFRGAAGYVDRILKGEKPGALPVQYATTYKLSVNLAAAKTLGLTLSLPLLGRADEVIE